jgi:hypothetical protein
MYIRCILTPVLFMKGYSGIMEDKATLRRNIMKAYLFDIENGLYEGETFENADMLQYEEGITTVPPPDYEHGQVPVFDRRNNVWIVIPVTIIKQWLRLNDETNTESNYE